MVTWSKTLNYTRDGRSVSRRQFLTYAGAGLLLGAPTLGWSQQLARSSDLQKRVNQLVKQQRRQGRIAVNERTAWSVYDFQTGRKLVSINEEQSLQAASMVKVFVALAYFYLNTRYPHRYPYTHQQRQLMEDMLVRSGNRATNQLMQQCGGPRRVAQLCQQATGYRFKQLRIVESIPKGGRTYQNRISARDYSRFLYDLWHDRLPRAKEIKRIMSIKNADRIRTKVMPETTKIVDKTGSTSRLCGNMGIIRLDSGQAYTFIGIIEKSQRAGNYTQWIKSRGDAMRDVSELVYRFMNTHYRLVKNIG